MSRSRARRLAVPAALVAAALLVMSCSPLARYRVLSAVLDGVPPPPGVEVPARPAPSASGGQPVSQYLQDLRTLREQRPKSEPAVVIRSVHKPVAERKCQECHDPSAGISGVPTDATLCDKCHLDQRREQGWDHGPINLGTCIPCHTAHRSAQEHLLSEPLPDLCLHCHQDTTPDGPEYHSVPNFGDCTACHDPHRMY